ncbi:MAG: class I SAM-dependent methyltransferase [Dehalococcoidia bacterium]
MPFFELQDLPVQSDVLLSSRAVALSFPRGGVRLGFCRMCGFIQNQLFDERCLEYRDCGPGATPSRADRGYEAGLAEELIDRYNLRGKSVLEIGCGDGSFLEQLCAAGGNLGTGIDPAAPGVPSAALPVEYIRDFFGADHFSHHADFIYSRHVLEETKAVGDAVSLLRRAVGSNREPVVFCEVADVRKMLIDLALWDFSYAQCSYFSAGSLSRLFRRNAFDVFDLRRRRDDCSLLIDAVVSSGDPEPAWEIEHDLDELARLVAYFRDYSADRLHSWSTRLKRLRDDGGRVVLWGAEPRAVSFVTSLGVEDDIEYVIDPRPERQGRYLPCTGHETAPPDILREYRPDLVIAMDRGELPFIEAELGRIGVTAEVASI